MDPNLQPIVLAVAAYASKRAAQQDFDVAWQRNADAEPPDALTMAMVEKGADGSLRVDRGFGDRATFAPWRRALLGSALVVVAPPLGILALAPILSSRAEWVGASGMVSQLWRRVSRAQLFEMSLQLEAGQAALMVVALDAASSEVGSLVPSAASAIVTDVTSMNLEQAFSRVM